MTQPIHTREQLEKFSISELRAKCDRLSISRRRSKEDCITDILAAQPQVIAQAEFVAHVEAQANEIAPDLQRMENNRQGYQDATNRLEMQSNDPCYRSGYDRGLRDVSPLPQEAPESVAITYEKIGQTIRGGVWEAIVDDIQILIIGVSGGYKSNLTGVRLIEEFGAMIKETLVAVAKIQEKQKLESAVRSPLAQAITVLGQQGDEFVVENSTNQNRYVVRPNHPDPNSRCECADCRHRGSKCKHQIAVENFLKPSLEKELLAA
ncbi:hypothetical protein [Nostoc sp. TCL240-02]|uniref:hypothetical protein n=1 Tax=Nostoc sp. TCL240-02 TaxID=2572090 RepID=UPI00157FA7C6|nr:hypothetical protein [Nostoc sp. TCL240-02]QKQ75558.1 hypothetical protein FBB35_21740 [Nostoc sp. TCL240-02]